MTRDFTAFGIESGPVGAVRAIRDSVANNGVLVAADSQMSMQRGCTSAKYHHLPGSKAAADDANSRVIPKHYSNILPAHRGIGIHSRTLSTPLIQLTSRSKPSPKPP